MEECGCKILSKLEKNILIRGRSRKYYIEFCPLHNAAPDILHTLQVIRDRLNEQPDEYMSTEKEALFADYKLRVIASLVDECLSKYEGKVTP